MSNLNSDDYYKILGVGRSATEAELKKAYRKLSIKVGRGSTGSAMDGGGPVAILQSTRFQYHGYAARRPHPNAKR